MESIELEERSEVFNSGLKVVRKILCIIVSVSLVMRLIEILYSEAYEKFLGTSSPLIRVAYLVMLYLLPTESSKFQRFMLHCILETFNLHLLYNALFVFPQEKSAIALLNCFCVLNFQMKLLKNFYYSLSFSVKFLLQWYWESLSLEGIFLRDSHNILPILMGLAMVLFNNKLLSESEETNMKLLRKAQDMQKKLTTVVQNFPTGMALLSLDLEVYITNQKALRYLNCTSIRLKELLESLEYLPSRRFHFLDEPNRGLFEDVKRYVSFDSDEELQLGLVEFNGQTLEFCVKKTKWGEETTLILTINNAERIIQLEKADTQNNCKNSLLRSVSHEMRTPLYAITSIADQLLHDESSNLTPTGLKNLSVLKVSSKLMLCLVNDLLDYSRMVSEAFRVSLSEFEVRELLQETLKMIQLQASKKKVLINLRIDELLPEKCFSDPMRLEQIIINLLSNALKFTCRGYIELTATYSVNKNIRISVTDTGIGIPSERTTTIFELFETTRDGELNSEGCGLGLHISNLLVKALGGEGIHVVSEVGKGSKFSFEVPISEEGGEVVETFSEHSIAEENTNIIEIANLEIVHERARAKEVLLVDDNDFTRIIISSVLKTKGFRVLEARNGREAVDTVKKLSEKHEDIKVVLMDCDMPVLNGWEATREIKQLYLQGTINKLPKIVGCSAFSDETEVKKSYDCGMVLHLIKPINNEVLTSTVQYFLDNS